MDVSFITYEGDVEKSFKVKGRHNIRERFASQTKEQIHIKIE